MIINIKHLRDLKIINLENINLENINLENINLENINLENKNLENINLENKEENYICIIIIIKQKIKNIIHYLIEV